VSRCREARATEHYFSTMPWAVMLHAEAMGARSLALRDKFAITTIPALVLLNGEGAVLCRNAHERLRDDPLGKHFPWESTPAAPRTPRVDLSSSGARPPAGSPRRSCPSTHGIHIQEKERSFKGRTKTATSPQAWCTSLTE